MADAVPTAVAATGTVWRVAYGADPWAWVPWQYAPFNGRFDDAQGQFRVLYAGETRLACYLEVTAQFRPDVRLLAELDALTGDAGDEAYPDVVAGTVPLEWLDNRSLGSATISGTYVAIGEKHSIAWLRQALAHRLVHYGLDELDGATIRAIAPRAFTQELSTLLYATPIKAGTYADGIRFESRHGDDLVLYAVYERPAAGDDDHSRLLTGAHVQSLDPTDPDLMSALAIHGLRLG